MPASCCQRNAPNPHHLHPPPRPLQLLAGKGPGERAVRRIAAADPSGRQALLDFAHVGADTWSGCRGVEGLASSACSRAVRLAVHWTLLPPHALHCMLRQRLRSASLDRHRLPSLLLPRQPPSSLPLAQYLRSKSRAGVVALAPLAPLGVQRTMYLVPPSEEVCRQLGISWHTSSNCLLALIVPMAIGR